MIDNTTNDEKTIVGGGKDVMFARRMVERLAGIDGVEVEVCHEAKRY
jgi:hypothetical protein